jgi:eukaryotic-like serine/threonine-protein kinase
MHTPHLVLPPPGSTAAERRRSRGPGSALPPDLLREASLRLGIMSLVAATLWAIGTVLGHIAFRATGPEGEYLWLSLVLPTDTIAGASFLASLALFVYTRRSHRDPEFILNVGLAYMVLMALALGLMFHFGLMYQWNRMPAAIALRPELSWIGAVVLMSAAIVPSTPRKTLVAGLVAVSMNPVGMLIARTTGRWDFGPAGNVLLMHYPDYLLVGVAVVISHVVTQLGRHVTKARELGSYQLGELLGRGGMGDVYKATHRMLARPAAIKLIRPEMLGAKDGDAAQLAVKRFYREAEAAASLRSPHTVAVYDFGVTDDQTLYFVMELLEGMDLESLVKRHGALPAGRVIYLLRQVCESLEEAHARGLVHRDIKPANIHVGCVALRHDFVKVLDFGLAKPVTGAGEGHSLETAAGLTPGTPAYMAPELALGETVDGRADIYALGCVAYYLLTSRLVFEADNAFQLVVKHLKEEPTPPSRRTELHVPAALDELVLACLAKEPERRTQSAAVLARSLAAIEPEVEPWGEEQAAQWWNALAEERVVVAVGR